MVRQIACRNILCLYWMYRPICCGREVAYQGGAQVVDFLGGTQKWGGRVGQGNDRPESTARAKRVNS